MSNSSDSTNLIDGIEVKFPYEPYSVQKSYMEAVIKAVRDGKNALLESPTGTGKTLSLICSTLASITADRNNKLNLDLKSDECSPMNLEDSLMSKTNALRGSLDQEEKKSKQTKTHKVKIIYTSRTHSQLKQVINEVKKSHYNTEFGPKKLKPVLLASRDLLCINKSKGNLTGEHLNNFCRAAVQTRSCRYYNIRGPKSSDLFQFHHLVDIEDMVKIGQESVLCPYFVTKDAQEDADLILVPYNYLLSSNVREAMDLNIKNSVVIIDEAHNVETTAENASSFSIRQMDIAKYMEALSRFASFHKDYAQDGTGESYELPKIDTTVLLMLGNCLKNTDNFMTGVTLLDPRHFGTKQNIKDEVGERWCLRDINRNHVVYSGKTIVSFIYDNLEYGTLNASKVEENLNQVVTMLTKWDIEGEEADLFKDHYNEKSLKEDIVLFVMLKKFFGRVLSKDLYDFPQFYSVIVSNDEKFENFKKPKSGQNSSRGWNRKFRTRSIDENDVDYSWYESDSIPKVLSFECMEPVPTFVRIVREGVRSIILTSGTLGPLDVLEKHIGGGHINFEIKLQNDHVIQPSRVWAGIVTGNNEDPRILSSVYVNRNNYDYISALGKTLLSFIKCVPSGILVFFGSYSAMYDTIDNWKRLGLYNKMESIKSIFIESRPQRSSKDNDIIPETTLSLFMKYKDNIDQGKGSMFFAICRGRLAEGIDFSDDYCRGIFLCGIPYPNRHEQRTALKIDYLDKLSYDNEKLGNKTNLSNEWYTSQAIIAINQAIGRSIRHIDDYGAIMLADHRFRMMNVKKNISKWILNLMGTYEKVEDCTEDLCSFFNRLEKIKTEQNKVDKKDKEGNENNKDNNNNDKDNKKEIEYMYSPIKQNNLLEFKSRDSNKNSKYKTMPIQKLDSDFNKVKSEYSTSITQYFSKNKRSQDNNSNTQEHSQKHSSSSVDSSELKEETLSFKHFEKWSFLTDDSKSPET